MSDNSSSHHHASDGPLGDFLSRLSSGQKAAAAAAGLLLTGLGGLLLARRLAGGPPAQLEEPIPSDSQVEAGSGDKAASSSSTAAGDVDAKTRVRELKEAGNRHFKHKRFEKAIEAYTEALALEPGDAQVLYSNRAAAATAMRNFEFALSDADRVIAMKPNWAKGYFRKGRALLGMGQVDEAYLAFYSGTLADPESQELKTMLEQALNELGLGDLDTRSKVESKLIVKHLEEISEEICKEHLNMSADELREAIKACPDDKAVFHDPTVLKAVSVSAVDAWRIVAQILLFEMPGRFEGAQAAVDKALAIDPEHAGAQLVAAHVVLRDTGDIKRALEHIRVALRNEPKGVLVAHTFASILVRVNPMEPSPIDSNHGELRQVLLELIPAVTNPDANRLLIADAGLRLWFRLFDGPEIKAKFEEEEARYRSARTPERQALIQGLETGSYSELVREPFFMQVLADVVLVNSMLERLLVPFRQAVALEKRGRYSSEIAPFCYALALQCFKNHYIWSTTDEEDTLIAHFASKLRRALRDEDERATLLDPETKKLTPLFRQWLSVISLYRNVNEVAEDRSALASVLREADLSEEHHWFRELIQKSILDREIERDLFSSIKCVTPEMKCEQALQDFFNNRIHPLWDMVQPSVAQRRVGQEMEWLFPHHNFKGFATEEGPDQKRDRVLVAGTGAGMDTEQLNTQYCGTDVVAIDISKPNLAYAARQCTPGSAEFIQADISALEPEHLGADAKPFDLIVSQNTLHHLADPVESWKRLVACMRPGGLFTGAVYSKRYIAMLREARKWLAPQFERPVFDLDVGTTDLPRVLRQPADEELRKVRSTLLEQIAASQVPWMQRGVVAPPPEAMVALVNMPAFYNLDQFRDLIFHPQVVGFDFTTLGDVLEEVGLKLVSFEFPSLPQDAVLRYRHAFPDDPHMTNCANLDVYDDKNELTPLMLSPHYLFVAEKAE